MAEEGRAPLIAVAVLTVLAFGLRIVGVDQSLFGDEHYTYATVTDNSLGGAVSDVYHTSVTPPLHYVLAWLSLQWGGDDVILLRVPSLIFGTALVPLVFAIGRRVAGARAGLLAAVVIALDPFAIWYSDEARAYALMTFLVAFSTFAMLRAADGGGRRWWVLWAGSACAALYSHYTAVFVIGAEALWALWVHRARWREIALVQVAIVVGYLPWVPGYLEQHSTKFSTEQSHLFTPDVSAGLVLSLPFNTLVGHPHFRLRELPGEWGLVLIFVVVVLAVVVAVRRPAVLRALVPLRSERGLMLILAVATPLGLLLYAAGGTSLFLARNLSASLPALAILVGLVLHRLAAEVPRWLGGSALAVFVAVLGINVAHGIDSHHRKPPYREAARYLDRTADPRDPVVETPYWAVFFRSPRLPNTTLDIYFQRPHPLFRAGPSDSVAWRQLGVGRSVYVVAPSSLVDAPRRRIQKSVREGAKPPPGLVERVERLGGPGGTAVVRSRKSLAGLVPVTVVRYQGEVNGSLERRGDHQIISWSLGRRIVVAPGAASGALDAAFPAPETLAMSGWALDALRRPADWILLFEHRRLIAVSAGGSPRPDVARTHGPQALLSGFALIHPSPTDKTALQAFAIVGNHASRLALSPAVRRVLR